MTTIAPHPRRKDPICPPWCIGHAHGADDWFAYIGGSLIRDHENAGQVVGGIGVRATQVENLTEGMEPARVWVSEDDSDVATHYLTSAQARELAAAIVAAADRIDAEAGR